MDTRLRTLQALADLLGLSRATVSRALNDSPLIAEATRLRVKQAAAEGRFAPNVSARRLTRGRSRTVAFVTHRSPSGPGLVDQLGFQLLDGITRSLAERGYETLLKPVDYRDYSWVRSMIDGGQVDGFIVLASSRKADHVQRLLDEQVPFVTWGAAAAADNVPSVEADDRQGGILAGRFLRDRYGSRIGELTGPKGEAEVFRRSEGFREGLGGRALEDWSGEGDWSEEWGEAWGRDLLGRKDRPRAVFCHGDRMALGLLRAAGHAGLRVPEDLAVLGFDNLIPGAWSSPPLSTVDPHLAKAGEALGEVLVRLLETGEVARRVLGVDLLVRSSA